AVGGATGLARPAWIRLGPLARSRASTGFARWPAHTRFGRARAGSAGRLRRDPAPPWVVAVHHVELYLPVSVAVVTRRRGETPVSPLTAASRPARAAPYTRYMPP